MASGAHLYRRLQQDGHIRLIRIRDIAGGKVSCELQEFSLQEERGLDYVAISYTWGPSTDDEAKKGRTNEPVCEITCNEKPLMVTENLQSFLLQAASDSTIASRWLWIDAISIDQHNEVEKEHQVNMMATIYHSAKLVLIWLGDEDEYTAKSFELVRALARLSEAELKSVTPKSLLDGTGMQTISTTRDRTHWLCLIKLFERRYFTRAWIIQEVTLATDRLAICGSQTIAWDDIVAVSKFLTITAWTRWMHMQGSLNSKASYSFNHTNPNFLEANRRTLRSGNKALLLISLIRGRRFQAADPRDKVYALLGVARSAVQGKARLEPVYGSRTVEDAYTKAAIQILEDSEDLLLLAHAEGDVFRSHPKLPSWVPDWSVARAVGLGVTGYTRYAASKDIKRYLDINEQNRSLVVRGMKLDLVKSVGESKAEVLQGKPFPQLLSIFCSMPEHYRPTPAQTHCTDQAPAEMLWRILITDTGGVEREHPASPHFAPAGLAWIRSRLENVADRVDDDLVRRSLQLLDAGVGNELPDERMDVDEYEATYSHAQHLRLFETSRNYFGVGSESVQQGDMVWIIAGSRVPLLLREIGEGTHRIVGGAYVHGFMGGEAFDTDDHFERIKIV